MESIDLEMGDLFDDEAGDDDDVGAVATTLPELDEDGDGPMRDIEDGENPDGENQDDEEGVVANLQRLAKGAAKKRVLRPQPKLNVDRLKSERGVAILPRIFENTKFKGKGHEADDLKLIMGRLEHWAHRLFPQATFDQFIERMEKLGAKKPVQTCIKQIRCDMPILDEDYVRQYDDDGPQEEQNDGDTVGGAQEEPMGELDAEAAFDEMIRHERELQAQTQAKRHDDSSSDEEIQMSCSTPSKGSRTPEKRNHVTPKHTQSSSQNQGMTPDMTARIEANKRRALEKRAARLGLPVEALLSPTPKKSQMSDVFRDASQSQPSSQHTIQSQPSSQHTIQSQPSTQHANQSQPSSQHANQSQPSSHIEAKTYHQSQSSSKNQTENAKDVSPNEQIVAPLDSDDNDTTINKQNKSSLDITDSDKITKSSDQTEAECSEKNGDNKMLETEDLKESESLNLLLDVSEIINPEESESLNLQLDLSVNETDTHSNGESHQNAQKQTETESMDVDS